MSMFAPIRGVRFMLTVAIALMTTLILGLSDASAQSALSFTGQLRSAYPQSTLAEPVAAVPRTCSSISNLSRRCFFTFGKECKARGESKDHCTRMSGFCHGCTDAYATCKGEQNALAQKALAQKALAQKAGAQKVEASGTDCTRCNVVYGQCISRMVAQYGGKLVRPK